jgi:hypothetical protein
MLVLGMVFIGCDNGTTDDGQTDTPIGTVTVTGLYDHLENYL